MCNFISAIKVKDEYFYLTKQDLKGKKFSEFKKENKEWYQDIMGHGAIEFFYPKLKGKGEHWECEDFSSPNNFPSNIVEDIKKGNFKGFGICEEILTPKALDEYNKIRQPALAEYNKIRQSALDEYNKIEQLAWDEYNKIEQPAFWKIAVIKKNRKKEWK